MRFRLLGLLDVARDDGAVPIAPGRESALLAIFLLNANRPVSVDRLVDELWAERPPANAPKAVQVYVSRLRKRLGAERLATTAGGYVLRSEADEVDVEHFRRLALEGRQALDRGSAAEAARVLSEALGLWRGPALADFRFDGFAQSEIQQLDELRLGVAADHAEARLALGEAAELLPELERLARENPLDERIRGLLMLCLYRCRRQAEALDAYRSTRTALVEQLGVEPGRALRELHQAILQQDPKLELASSGPRRVERPRGALVGRAAELAALDGALDEAAGGRGHAFFLVGEAGIGKSRLAEEVASRAGERGMRVLVGRCWEAGGAPAYWPWVQSLRTYVRDTDPTMLRSQVAGGETELGQILPELQPRDATLPPQGDAEGARFRLFDAIVEFLRSAAEQQPIVLVLDDLHAADAPSLLLLQFLVRQLGSMRLVVIGCCRDVGPFPHEALSALLAEVAREPLAHRMSLLGLSEDDIAEYLEVAAAGLLSQELVEALHDETDGNPLFVTETVRLLAHEGIRFRPGRAIAIPQTVRDVIARRLSHLSAECNRVLVLASVLGREFELAALARVAETGEDALLEVLDEAMRARVVTDVPDTHGRLRFAHVLIRDTLYEGLTAARRTQLHRQTVAALEARYGSERGPHLAELAHHAIAGSDLDRGRRYARRAGDRALELLAYEEAAELYETAIGALDPAGADDAERCELLLALGEARLLAGDALAAKRAFLDAGAVARRRDLPRELARAAVGYGGRSLASRGGGDPRLVPFLEEALAVLADRDIDLRVKLLSRLAGALRDERSRSRRDEVSKEAVELARLTANPAALAYALDGRAMAIAGPDTIVEVLELAEEACSLGERVGDGERAMRGHEHCLLAHVALGNVPTALAELEKMNMLADELKQPLQAWHCRSVEAMIALATGRLADGARLTSEAFALGERAQPEMATPVYHLQRHTLCDFVDRLEEVEPDLRTLAVEHENRPVFRCVLAQVHARLGRVSDARAALDDLAANDVEALPFDQEWLYGMSLLAETCALLDDAATAAVLYRALVPWGVLNVSDHPEGFRGAAARYLGMLAAMTDVDEAPRHFQAALDMNERMGAAPWLALTQEDFGRFLLARGREGEREHGRQLLAAADEAFRLLGMRGYSALEVE